MPAIIFSHQVPFDFGWPTNCELCVSTALAKFSDTATSTTREAGRKDSSGVDRAQLNCTLVSSRFLCIRSTVL